MRTDFQTVLVEQEENIVFLSMNRPEVLNAMNTRMLQELTEAVETLAHNPTIRCVVLTGAGRAFGSGQDITEFGSTHSISEHLAQYHRLISALRQMPTGT